MYINRWMNKEAVYYSAIKRNAFELVLIDFWFTFGNRVKMREKFQAPDIFAKLPYLLLRYHLYFLNVFCYKCPSFPKSPVFQKMPLSPTPWHLLSSISTPGCSHPLKSHFFVNLCTWLLLLSLSHVHLFATPWTATCQASLSFTISQSLLKLNVHLVEDAT